MTLTIRASDVPSEGHMHLVALNWDGSHQTLYIDGVAQ